MGLDCTFWQTFWILEEVYPDERDSLTYSIGAGLLEDLDRWHSIRSLEAYMYCVPRKKTVLTCCKLQGGVG